MSLRIATFVGGPHDGRKVAVDHDSRYADMPARLHDLPDRSTTRYRKVLWPPAYEDHAAEVFFIPDTLTEQQEATLLD